MRSIAAAALAAACWGCNGGSVATITVDTSQTFQTMTGWEFTGQGGQDRVPFQQYADTLLRLAADLGLNRIRLEVRSGMEHRRDYWRETLAGRLSGDDARCARYETDNDNADPRVTDTTGFHFGELDRAVESLVLPLQRLLAARGERLIVSVNYIAFFRQCPAGRKYEHQNPDEYAEFALAVVTHLRARYGIVPDFWEVILEPDNTDFWNGRRIGEAIVATAARFREQGITTRFVAPSNTSASRAIADYDAMMRVPGVRGLVAEFAYHRYKGVSHDALREIARRGARDSVRTAMLEHIGSGVDDLIDDLTIAGTSAWQQYALAYPGNEDRGGLYFGVDERDPAHPVVRTNSRTRLLAQVFRYVRLGDVRIGATSTGGARVVAFRGREGRLVVIVRGGHAAQVAISGLPAGRYGTTWTTADTSGAMADTTITSGGMVRAAIPAAGVVTVFGR